MCVFPSQITKPNVLALYSRDPRSTANVYLCTIVQPASLATLSTLLLASPLVTIFLILFGAPLTTHFAHNILCGTHMALLMFQPLFYVYGVDAVMWREICSAFLPWDGVWGGTIGTMLGAWCGAVPIPLDWCVIYPLETPIEHSHDFLNSC